MGPPGYKVIDLFAGAGGLAYGLKLAGLEPILAVEKEPDFAATYAANIGPHVLTGDIRELISNGYLDCEADIVAGGPPCQGFSNLTGNKQCDPRRGMWEPFMDVVERSKCKVFLIENVPNLLKSEEGHAVIKRAELLGFHVRETASILVTSDYGVPQNRRRAIIMGSRLGPMHFPEKRPVKKTVREAFEGIPGKPLYYSLAASPAIGSDLHIGRNPTDLSKARYRAVPPGGNRFDLPRELTPGCWIRKTSGGTDLFGRLAWDGPARCTVRTEFYKPEKGRFLHPEEHRPITHWEAARLQSFPDSFEWHGTKIRIAIQIGNAVPPDFSKALGAAIVEHLKVHRQRPSAKPRYTLSQRQRFGQCQLITD